VEALTDIPLKEHTWFRTGGPAAQWCEPVTPADFCAALRAADDEGRNIFVIGDGANVLVSDQGFDGLVIHPGNATVAITGKLTSGRVLVTAGAGVLVDDLIEWTLEQGLTGLELFSGIPGTVGGAVYINIHYFEALLADVMYSARIVNADGSDCTEVMSDWFEFGYDTSRLHQKSHYVVEATFALQRVGEHAAAFAQGRRHEIIRHRQRRYPEKGTCGSFFRNFLPEEVPFEVNGEKILHVAYYLDKLGVKGELREGDAMVSEKHANMIVNRGNATSADIVAVAQKMQEMVKAEFGLVAQPECQFVGFAAESLAR
jgi:UDP-N-acetylmuramate dehydrogenase